MWLASIVGTLQVCTKHIVSTHDLPQNVSRTPPLSVRFSMQSSCKENDKVNTHSRQGHQEKTLHACPVSIARSGLCKIASIVPRKAKAEIAGNTKVLAWFWKSQPWDYTIPESLAQRDKTTRWTQGPGSAIKVQGGGLAWPFAATLFTAII
jgi:hypothetical protein